MNESLLHRIAINRTGQPLKQFARMKHNNAGAGAQNKNENKILDAISVGELSSQIENTDKNNLETIPRKTTLKLVSMALDVHFSFRVAKGEAENYMGAMRQVLSRTRKKAKRKRMILDEFKMLHVSTDETHGEYDIVTLVRSKTLSPHEESVFDELMAVMAKTEKK